MGWKEFVPWLPAQCRHGDARGLEVSAGSLLQNELIQRACVALARSHPLSNRPEFVAKAVQEWIGVVGAKSAYIERGRLSM
jgi:hypothetical protein